MDIAFVKPINLCESEFEKYEQTDSIIIHRQFYNDFVGKILTQPYLLLLIKSLDSDKSVIVTLGGIHHGNQNDVYIPSWLYRGLSDNTEGVICRVVYNDFELLTLEQVAHCRIKINISPTADIDLRTNIEMALTNLHTLKKGMKIPVAILEFEGYEEELEIIELKNSQKEDISEGFIATMSEVTLDLETLPELPATGAAGAATVPDALPVPPQAHPQPKELTAEERMALVRNSWLKKTE
jgi:hypothetical protein